MKFQNWSEIKEFSSVCTFSKKLTYAEKVGWWPAERFLLIWSQLITLWRTCLQVELNIFHEREARAVDFLCFLRQKRARERDGNERRRTLRKSNHDKPRGKGGGGGGAASIPCTFLNFLQRRRRLQRERQKVTCSSAKQQFRMCSILFPHFLFLHNHDAENFPIKNTTFWLRTSTRRQDQPIRW